MEVIIEILSSRNISYEKSDLLLTYDALYDGLIEEIDAIDNGVPMCPEGISPVYTISTHLGSRVHRLNPEWNSTEKTSLDELFQKAVSLVGTEFLDKLLRVSIINHVKIQGYLILIMVFIIDCHRLVTSKKYR